MGNETVVTQSEAKLDLAPVAYSIGGVLFSETNVHIEPIFSRKNNKHYLKITIGVNQDKVFMVTTRKDGRGVCTLTDWKDYQYKGKTILEQKV